MSGIYILKNKDGYRVSYADNLNKLYLSYNINGHLYNLCPEESFRIFNTAEKFETIDKALEYAKLESRNYRYLDDGIFVIRDSEHLTFGDLINGSTEKL